jgi:putative SOS response-associated peptidase YedK
MLTTEPGPDVEPYHDRQICVLPQRAGMHWLRLDMPEAALLKPPPRGTLEVQTVRRDGVEVVSSPNAGE